MKKANINITCDEEKLNAIRLFLTQKGFDLDTELDGFLDFLFKKHVPVSVRDFIQLKHSDNTISKRTVQKSALQETLTKRGDSE